MFCFGIVAAAMMVMLLLLIIAGLCDLCDSLTDNEAELIWDTMKACAYTTVVALCILALAWLIYGAVLILLTL